MDHTRGNGQVVFTSHAWRRMFEIHGPLVLELMLEFFSTCRFSDTELGLDVVDTFCFQIGGLRRQMSWRQFILALGLHTADEMGTDDFGAYWADSLMRTFLALRGQAPEKVTATNLFYLRSMDEGTVVNGIYLLAQYLFRYAEGRKQRARMSGGYFVVALEPERQQVGAVARAAQVDPKRLQRLEEEMHEVREGLGEQREVIDRVSTDFARFSAWVVGGLGQLLDVIGISYQSLAVSSANVYHKYCDLKVTQRATNRNNAESKNDARDGLS
ncbi:hypothetical protein Tco_0666627 [Tanacetum coccineum]